MPTAELREEDLYFPVKKYLNERGYEVKGEVNHCDVTAVKQDTLLIVEMKKSLNLDVILQSVLRQRITNTVYIAVPKSSKVMRSKRWKNCLILLRRLGVGLLTVSVKENSVTEALAANPNKCDADVKPSKRLKASTLNEFEGRHGDLNKGGITKTKLVTAYREMALKIAFLLKENGPLSPAGLKKLGTDTKKTYSILYHNHYGWFTPVSKGIYQLTDEGIKALLTFNAVTDSFTDDEQEWDYL